MTNVDHDKLEELLRHAAPRPAPPPAVADAARDAVRDAWRIAVGQRRRRNVFRYAVAAAALVGVFAGITVLRPPAPVVVQVAAIDKSVGPVYVLGEQAELQTTDDLATIMSGQTIMTGAGAGLAVSWGDGGSLRLDQNTRVEFTDVESVFLQAGRVYFDSRDPELGVDTANSPAFRLHTAAGQVRHIGTQYMAHIDGDTLVVSVREGEVAIEGNYHDHRAQPGEQVTLSGSLRPSVLSIAGTGDEWGWITAITPTVDVDGRNLLEFLGWASRELGLQLVFEGGAQAVAQSAILRGSIESSPADALRMRLASAALSWRIEGGIIYVGDEP